MFVLLSLSLLKCIVKFQSSKLLTVFAILIYFILLFDNKKTLKRNRKEKPYTFEEKLVMRSIKHIVFNNFRILFISKAYSINIFVNNVIQVTERKKNTFSVQAFLLNQRHFYSFLRKQPSLTVPCQHI